jgi:dolichol-phosphate mannosyltransferase
MVLRWLGFSSSHIKIEHQQRDEGSSSYNFKRLIEHAINGITFSSEKVLRLNIFIGLFIAMISLLGGFGIIIKHLLHSNVPGWTSIIFISLFSLGIILFSIGVLGVYIGQIFSQVKNRQKYIIEKKISNNYD